MLYWQLHLLLWQCGLGAFGKGVWDCYIPCRGFATRPRSQYGAIWTLTILVQQTNRLFDCRYLGPFDRPAQDVIHLVMTVLPWATSMAGEIM